MPGILVMFLMFAVTLGSQSFVDERRGGTLERLMTTRLGINQLFIGKFLAGVLRASFQAAVLLTLAFVVLRFGGTLRDPAARRVQRVGGMRRDCRRNGDRIGGTDA